MPHSPLGEACVRADLTAIHEIVEKLGYKDDEGAATEVPFLIPVLFCLIIASPWQDCNLWHLRYTEPPCFL